MKLSVVTSYNVTCDRCGDVVSLNKEPIPNIIFHKPQETREELWLCDECFNYILEDSTGKLPIFKTQTAIETPQQTLKYWLDQEAITELNESLDKELNIKHKSEPIATSTDKEETKKQHTSIEYADHRAGYINNWVWNDDNIEMVVKMREEGKTIREIASLMQKTTLSISGMLSRIKEAKPGYDLFKWKDRVNKSKEIVYKNRFGNHKKFELTDENVERVVRMREENHSVRDIGNVFNVSDSTICRLYSHILESNPDDFLYKWNKRIKMCESRDKNKYGRLNEDDVLNLVDMYNKGFSIKRMSDELQKPYSDVSNVLYAILECKRNDKMDSKYKNFVDLVNEREA